ncbi:alpha-N-methyltransferase NTM1 [Crucibulum laeve]|uniref:Alpha N-terminal protein methyltransferase 1 n=1 Tax=Crucibulum laeve TaxID=68775 RepID=A0A5C3MCZ0_9AGAR|nr:alpha-N-methyltransferase NTM1 [Crucibulum laeve]
MASFDSEREPAIPEPVIEDGIDYWNTQPASLDGVLGGFGSGSLPRIDSLGSRLFLLNLYPELCTVPSAIKPLTPQINHRIRALDVGAGIGRVTADVLLHLVSDVVILEPVESFVQEALARARASVQNISTRERPVWTGLADQTKSVTLLQGTLQVFDPLNPHRVTFLDRLGYQPTRPQDEIGMGFDVIWCQWCLGHLSDPDLVTFLTRSHAALREKEKGRSLIVVKENLCSDKDDGTADTIFDVQDSSLTRSDLAWKNIFKEAGLKLVDQKVQEGLPQGLYAVKMYALR